MEVDVAECGGGLSGGEGRPGADAHGAVAAEHERHVAGGQGRAGRIIDCGDGGGCLREVLGAGGLAVRGPALERAVAEVAHLEPAGFEGGGQARGAERGGRELLSRRVGGRARGGADDRDARHAGRPGGA